MFCITAGPQSDLVMTKPDTPTESAATLFVSLELLNIGFPAAPAAWPTPPEHEKIFAPVHRFDGVSVCLSWGIAGEKARPLTCNGSGAAVIAVCNRAQSEDHGVRAESLALSHGLPAMRRGA